MLFYSMVVMMFLGVQAQTYTSCTDIPQVHTNYEDWVLASPLKMLRSSNPAFACATAVVTGPAGLGGNTNYTFLLIQGKKVTLAHSVTSLLPSEPDYDCHDGTESDYRHLAYNLSSDQPYIIGYVCDGSALTLVNAYGRDEGVGPTIDAVINQYFSGFNGSGINVKTVWTTSCPATSYCGGLFN